MYIRSFSTYIPKYRLGKDTVGWGSSQERTVANFDEDSVTMAVAAGMSCLKQVPRDEIDGLLFATTSPPYLEKQGASIIATALDLRREVYTNDITGVLRAGTSALKIAVDTIKAGSARNILVLAADSRQAPPRGQMEKNIGDGSVGFVISAEKSPIVIDQFFTLSENMLDSWRSSSDEFIQSWEERFVYEEGLDRILQESVSVFMNNYGFTAKDFTKVGFYSPTLRRYNQIGMKLGFTPEQLQEPYFGKIGNTGVAYSLMLLAGALEDSCAGDSILIASYGDGSDVVSFKIEGQDPVDMIGTSIKSQIEFKTVLKDYETYARWRQIWTSEAEVSRPGARTPSVTAMWREQDQNLRLYGGKCNHCSAVQYPAQRICNKCQAKDDFTSIRLADKRGRVFTYSMDSLSGTIDAPLVIAVINFESGGRMLAMMTDRELDQIAVDMEVEMSFRRLRVVGGIHNYYWKAIPVRDL